MTTIGSRSTGLPRIAAAGVALLGVTVLTLVAPPIPVQAQETAREGDNSAGAELPTWSEPSNLGPRVNSPFNERFAAISPDGLTLYFASDRPRGSGDEPEEDLDLFVSTRPDLDAAWSEAERLPAPINTASHGEHSVTFSPDGHLMYFVRENAPDGCGGWDIYVSYREDPSDDFGWQEPQHLGCEINSPQNDSCPLLKVDDATGRATLYFTSTREGGLGSWDVYSAERAGGPASFEAAVHMPEVSSPAVDGHFDPFEEGLAVVWSSREGTLGGLDLWISAREPQTGEWGAPVNAGSEINTEHWEGMPSTTADGEHLFFASDRPGGHGELDVYMSHRIRP